MELELGTGCQMGGECSEMKINKPESDLWWGKGKTGENIRLWRRKSTLSIIKNKIKKIKHFSKEFLVSGLNLSILPSYKNNNNNNTIKNSHFLSLN